MQELFTILRLARAALAALLPGRLRDGTSQGCRYPSNCRRRAPVSQPARRRELVRGWGQEVQRAASLRWDTEPVAEGIMVIISYFFDGEALDVDNVPKPILDAMSGLVFADDAQVTDLLCRKRDVKLPLDIDRPSPLLLGTF